MNLKQEITRFFPIAEMAKVFFLHIYYKLFNVTSMQLTLQVPDEVLISLKKTPFEFSKELLLISSIILYNQGKLSSGRAAELAGIPRLKFLHVLSEFQIPIFNPSTEEIIKELENA